MKRFLSLVLCFVFVAVVMMGAVNPAIAETITLSAGVYNVGKDIPAGEYEILCTEASDPYNEYLDLMKSLSDDESLQSLWNLYGSQADEPTVTVTIRGTSGETKKKFQLEKNEKKTVTLQDNYSIKIEDGTCTLELKKEIASTTSGNDTGRSATSSDEWECPNCSNIATGNFCNNCGTARPENSPDDSASSENDDIVGTWLATHVVYNGVTVDISSYDMSVTMQLNANGSATIITNDGEEEGTWVRNSNALTVTTDESGAISGTIDDSKITLNFSGNSIIFGRELTNSSVSLPSPITATSEEEFYGTWNMSRVAAQGIVLTPVELAAMGSNEDITLTISHGNARADIVTNGKQDYNEFNTSFSNGRLQLKSKYNSVVLSVILTDSGELFTTITSDGVTRQIYFTKEGAEALASVTESTTPDVPSETPTPTETPVPTEVPDSEAKESTIERQFSFMPDRWNLYKATATSSTSWKIEKWSRWNAATDDFKYDYNVSSFDVSDSSYGFVWTDETQSAFFITLDDSRNSDLDQQRIGFSINPEAVPDAGQCFFTNDRWAQYKAYILSPSTIKIECWGRWNASTDDFEHYYDIGVIDINDPSIGFAWTDNTHSAFFITMEDEKNDNWKRGSAKVGFTVDPASVSNATLFSFTNDRWAQYRAYALSPSLVKIECWGRWNASTDDFEHYYDIGVIDTNDPSSDFVWTDDSHSAFFITMEDELNDNWKRDAEKIGFSIDPETISGAAQYTYLYDNWNLYKAYAISPNIIKIACWGRWNYNTDDFEHYYDVCTIKVDDPTNDFIWSDNAFTAFSVSIIDYNNDDLDSLTKVSFALDKEKSSAPTMATTAPKATATTPPITETPNPEQGTASISIPDSQKDIEANWNENDFKYKVNSDGTAKLTKYSGSAKTLIIAEEIDGHPIKEIGERTFSHNSTLKSIIVPSTVTIIGEHAFSYADDLEQVTLLGPVDKIEDNAFYNCSRLVAVSICGNNVTIGERAFSHCSKLKSVTIAGSVSEVSKHAFSYCDKLETVSPLIGLTKLKENAFYNCTSLKSAYLSGQNLVVEERAFSHCSSIKEITIAGSLSKIDTHAFSYCSKLEEITLAAGLTKIGNSAFTSCSRLKKINYCGSKDEWNSINVGTYNRPLDSATIVYSYTVPDELSNEPIGTTEKEENNPANEVSDSPTPAPSEKSENSSYTASDVRTSGKFQYVLVGGNAQIIRYTGNESSVSISSSIDGHDITSIGAGAFKDCTSLKSLTIWADIVDFGDEAFMGCSNLKSISIPSSTRKIGKSAFKDCIKLASVIIWGDVDGIRESTFENCKALKKISISSSAEFIDKRAFYGCEKMTSAIIWGDPDYIGESAFEGCSSLQKISISSGTKEIRDYAFKGCSSMSSATLWGDTNIGNYAFQGCTKLSKISISSGTEYIGDYAFEGCTNLSKVTMWGRNTTIGIGAFDNCPNLNDPPKSSSNSNRQSAVTPTPAPAVTSTPVAQETSTPQPNNQNEIITTSVKGGEFKAGTYLVGRDIAPGKYLFTGTGAADIYYSCPNDQFDEDTYIKEGSIWKAGDSAVIDLKANTYFMITLHPVQIDLYELTITDDQAFELPVGTYHVGTDIAPGSYLFVGTGPADILLNCKDDNFLEGTFVKEGSIWKAGDSAVLDLKENTYFQVTLHAVNISKYQFSLSEGEEKELPVGIYHVGTDIPEGKYYFIGKSTTDILYNCPDNSFTEGTYIKEGSIWSDKDIVLLNLVKDTYVYVQLHAVNIKRFSGITIDSDGGTLPVGIYHVGEDFPAGTYTFVGTGAADILYNCKDDQFRDGTYEKDGSIWSAGNTTKLTLKDNTYVQITIKPVIIKK